MRERDQKKPGVNKAGPAPAASGTGPDPIFDDPALDLRRSGWR